MSVPVLNEDQVAFFHNSGFLVLPGFMPETITDGVNEEIGQLTSADSGRYPEATIDMLHSDRAGRYHLAAAPDNAFAGPVKINDLYMFSSIVRACNGYPPLLTALDQLLGGSPMICNSLNFIYGSQQPPHIDTWYMPPPAENKMVVASICLDDMNDLNGPLIYFPGSHLIPPFRFSHGNINFVPGEMPACGEYLASEIEARGLKQERFIGRAGDVFIWHAQLLHGGDVIKDPTHRRRSLVTHYWRAQDMPAEQVADLDGVLIMKRQAHAVPAAAA